MARCLMWMICPEIGSGHCWALLADTPLQCHMEVRDTPGGSYFQKWGPEGVIQFLGYHTAQLLQESLFQRAGKEALANCCTSDSGGAMRIPSWPWNGGPAVYPYELLWRVMGVCPSSWFCVHLIRMPPGCLNLGHIQLVGDPG